MGHERHFGADADSGASAEANIRVVRRQPAADHAGNITQQTEPPQSADMNVVEEAVIELGLPCERKRPLAATHADGHRQRRHLSRESIIQLNGQKRKAIRISHCADESQTIEWNALQTLYLAGFSRDHAVKTNPEIVDEMPSPTIRGLNEADIDTADDDGVIGPYPPIRGEIEAEGVIIGRAERQDGEHAARFTGKQTVGNFVNGPISACRADDAKAGVGGLLSQFLAVTRCVGRPELRPPAEHAPQPVNTHRSAPAAGMWIVDDADVGQLHHPNHLSFTVRARCPSCRTSLRRSLSPYIRPPAKMTRDMSQPSFDGLLVLDKPPGITSRDAVDRAQRWFPRRTRIGHTGTLDPLATGVLVLCIGSATRLTEYVQQMRKTYTTTIRLGARSDTDDAEGIITPTTSLQPPDRAAVEATLREFVGDIDQTPPTYSAAKVTGRRAYDLARKGETVELTPRRVRIHGITLIRYEYPALELEVLCGKGTYIRSLARDIGERLGCGGYVQVLRRTCVGPFLMGNAVPLDADSDTARASILPLSAAVSELRALSVDDSRIRQLRHGQIVTDFDRAANGSPEEDCAIISKDGELVAVAHWDRRKGILRATKVLLKQRQ